MTIKLCIDFREGWFVDKIESDTKKFEEICEKSVENLEVGDFVIKNEQQEVLFIIERKTFNDLASSIVDGRFAQQKERIMNVVNSVENDTSNNSNSISIPKVMYILEGSKRCIKSNINKKCIDGAIQNMILKHNIKLLFTESQDDTYANILMLCNKCKEMLYDDSKCVTNSVAPTNIDLKIGGKKCEITKNIFALQMSLIPGISYKTGCIISEKYKNMSELIYAYNQCIDENEMKEMLSDIQISEKRKIGKSLSSKIYKCLF